MRKIFLFVGLMFLSITGFAQNLKIYPISLNFVATNEITPDSLSIVIRNDCSYNVNVSAFRFYSTYGKPAFSTGQGQLTLNPGDSSIVWIKFSPRHNIFHNTELVII